MSVTYGMHISGMRMDFEKKKLDKFLLPKIGETMCQGEQGRTIEEIFITRIKMLILASLESHSKQHKEARMTNF